MADRKKILPLLPCGTSSCSPHGGSLFVGRDKSVAALEAALSFDRMIFLSSQIDPSTNERKRTRSTGSARSATSSRCSSSPTAPSGAGGGAPARKDRPLPPERPVLPGERRGVDSRAVHRTGGRGDDPQRPRLLRELRQAKQEDPAGPRDAGLRVDDPARLADTSRPSFPSRFPRSRRCSSSRPTRSGWRSCCC